MTEPQSCPALKLRQAVMPTPLSGHTHHMHILHGSQEREVLGRFGHSNLRPLGENVLVMPS